MAAHGGRIDARNIAAAAAGSAAPAGTARAGLEMRLWWPAPEAASGADDGTALSPG
jgi:hypothetical protein